MRLIDSKCISFPLLLTGTPLQNNMTELGTLLRIILSDAGIGLDIGTFTDSFQMAQKTINTDLLMSARQVMDRLCLRRVKSKVEMLPPKTEIELRIPLTAFQKKLASSIMDGANWLQNSSYLSFTQLMAIMASLRKVG